MSNTVSLIDAPRHVRTLGAVIPRHQIYIACVDGELATATKNGGRWFIERTDLEVWAKSRLAA